jgi:hypothetical protein
MIRISRAFVFSASLLLSHAAAAQDARSVSEDAATLFGDLCIATRGNPQRIDQAITTQRLQAAPLSDEGVQTLLEGKPGDLGWLIRTARGSGVQLHVQPPTNCNVRAMESDDAAVNAVLAAVLDALAASEGFTFEKAMDERRQTNAGEEHLVGYRLFWRNVGWSANLGISHIAGDGNDIPPQVNIMLALRQTT